MERVRFGDLDLTKRVKIWLVANDLTQAELARRMGLSRVYLTQIINGHKPAPDTIREYFWKALRVPPKEWDSLVANGGEKEGKP